MNLDNIVILTGRLTADPETRYTDNKRARCSFSVATRDGKDADGKPRSQFHNCVAWNKTAELIDQYFAKGDPISVSGELTSRTYERDGTKHRVTEVRVSSIGFPLTKKTEAKNAFEDIDEDVDLPF